VWKVVIGGQEPVQFVDHGFALRVATVACVALPVVRALIFSGYMAAGDYPLVSL
jgi:hypothetical protein